MRTTTLVRWVMVLVLPLLLGCTGAWSLRTEGEGRAQEHAGVVPLKTASEEPTATFQSDGPVYSIAISPGGRFVALGGTRRIEVWDVSRRVKLQSLATRSRDVVALAFGPNNDVLASGGYQAIELWDIDRGEQRASFPTQSGYVSSLAFSPDGALLASGSQGGDGEIHIWDLTAHRLQRRLSYLSEYADNIRALAFSQENHSLASVGLDQNIRLWDLGVLDTVPRIVSVPAPITAGPSISPNQNMLAVGTGDGGVFLFDAMTGKIVRVLKGHRGEVRSVAFASDGKTVISAGVDQTIRRWEVETGREINDRRLVSEMQSLTLSADGRYLATSETTGIRVFAFGEKEGIPPVIAILTPSEGDTVDRPTIRLSGKVVDDHAVAEVLIAVNDVVRVPRPGNMDRDLTVTSRITERTENTVFVDEEIELKTGENRITVTAFDRNGLSRSETVRVTYVQEEGEVWGAVIGISDYQHVGRLKYADADARAFYRYLIDENQIPEDHVTLLLNEQATLQGLRDVLGVDLKRKAGKQDTVIIFYAGHGAPEVDQSSSDGDGLEKYLVPYDADPDRLYSTALPMAEISKIFSRLAAERIILLQDTCFSGTTGVGGRTVQTAMFRAPISETFLNRVAGGKGRVIITASEANEVSLERDDLGHGVFSYYLLEAFRHGDIDGNGLITTNEAFRYVSEKVPGATDQNQHPVKKGVETREIVLGRAIRN